MSKKLLAVLCNDIHLSHNPPASRDVDRKGWYDLQKKALRALGALAAGPDANKNTPIICAGDVFDKWNSPPELIEFALRYLPQNFYSIPGQHDLPNHAYDQRHRSAYGVCVQARAIKELHPHSPNLFPGLRVTAFPWGEGVKPRSDFAVNNPVDLAVIHHFIWEGKSTGYPGAPKTSKVPGFVDRLKGYDVAHFGDNHKHFTAMAGDCKVWNGGGFMVRKRDERREGMIPVVAKLYRDGDKVTLEPVYLEDDGEWLSTDPVKKSMALDMADFVQEVQGLADSGVDYHEAVKRYTNDNVISPKAAKLLKEAFDD